MAEIDDMFDLPDPGPTPARPRIEADPRAIRRDHYGRYILPDPDDPERFDRVFTRVTTLVKAASGDHLLHLWDLRMTVLGLVSNPSLYAMIAATDPTDRNALNQLVREAQTAAGAKARALLGSAIHAFCEQGDRGHDISVPELWAPEVRAYSELMSRSGLRMSPEFIERVVAVPQWNVAGTFDRLARVTRALTIRMGTGHLVTLHPGQYVDLDIKTGDELGYGWQEIAGQQACYVDAMGMWVPGTRTYEPLPERLRKDVALIAHIPIRKDPEDHVTATLHAVDLTAGRASLALACTVREWRSRKDVAVSVPLDQVTGAFGPDELDLPNAPVRFSRPAEPVSVAGTLTIEGSLIVDEPVTMVLTAPDEPAPTCPARHPSYHTPCVVEGEHALHRSGIGSEWVHVPDGEPCPVCERPCRNGKVTHKRGCIGAPPRGRRTRVEPELTSVSEEEPVVVTPDPAPVARFFALDPTHRPEPDQEGKTQIWCLACTKPIINSNGVTASGADVCVQQHRVVTPAEIEERGRPIVAHLKAVAAPVVTPEPAREEVFTRLAAERVEHESRKAPEWPVDPTVVEPPAVEEPASPWDPHVEERVPAVMGLYGPLSPDTGEVWADGLGTYVLPGEVIVRCPCGSPVYEFGDRCIRCDILRHILEAGTKDRLIQIWKVMKARGLWSADQHGDASKARLREIEN
jgi:hypothetical protein